MKKQILSVHLLNKPGALSRVTGLFSGRCFNIESLCVAPTPDPKVSILTLVTRGEPSTIEQIIKQLHKLIDVIKIADFTGTEYVEREMVLIKVKADASTKAEILRTIDIFRGKVIDVSSSSYTVEVTGSESKVNAVIDALTPIGIKEIIRTGIVAMARSSKNR